MLLRQKLAIVVFTVTGPILAMDFWQNGGRLTFFGEVPLKVLLEIASVGGAVSFLLYAKRREMPWAWIAGGIAGFGAFYVHIWYTVWFEKESLWNVESIFVALVGALPGILMYWGISRILRPRKLVSRPPLTSFSSLPSQESGDPTFSKSLPSSLKNDGVTDGIRTRDSQIHNLGL